jgi:DNA invertase Pin-like site-specific DNA recombinase/ribosomal protein S27AE
MNGNLPKTAHKPNCLNIAAYLRISLDDGADLESQSITNQRALIRSYIAGHGEFNGAALTDYIDDGISGSRSDRDAYVRLLRDIERGAVDCVVVKDLSRIGRNMLDVDDLLMNFLVTLNVRFIAINNGYDSFSSPLSNLELAIINLANQHYSRDLAVKSMTAKNVKSKRGEYLALAPFGYKKSETEKNKLVPDEEAAEYVRLIFSLAGSGHRTVEIAQILNAQGVPSPSVYKIRNGWSNMWTQVIDPDYCFWTNGVIYKMLKNTVYLGTLSANRFKVTEPGTGHTAPRPPDEWIVVQNAHEPLVSEEDFKKAQAVLQKRKYFDAPEHIFGNKVKCPACGHAMVHYTKHNTRFKCGTAKMTGHYGCKTHTILQRDVEKIVLASIRTYADVLLDYEQMKLAQILNGKLTVKGLEGKIAAECKAIELLESSVTKIFTSLASGKITKDAFLHKKEVINDTVARKRSDIDMWSEKLRELTEGRAATETAIAELKQFRTLETLNRDIIELLIDKILVHGENDIEIVWNGGFGEPGVRS